MSENQGLKLKKMAKKRVFLHILTESIRGIRQKTFILAIFVGPVVKDNRNELQYRKSAKTDDFISRKTLILAIFGPLAPIMHN